MSAIMIPFWPISTVWVLGVFVGDNLTSSGAAIVTAGLAARSFAGVATPVPAPARAI